jgi:hypothetical protein
MKSAVLVCTCMYVAHSGLGASLQLVLPISWKRGLSIFVYGFFPTALVKTYHHLIREGGWME